MSGNELKNWTQVMGTLGSLLYSNFFVCGAVVLFVISLLRYNSHTTQFTHLKLKPATRITTSCWTVINRKTLELTKKDNPHTKTKEKPQWDGRRGAITIKSNPITAGWVTHKLENTSTTEAHPLEGRFWAPRQASQPGDPATGGGIPRESDFEG